MQQPASGKAGKMVTSSYDFMISLEILDFQIFPSQKNFDKREKIFFSMSSVILKKCTRYDDDELFILKRLPAPYKGAESWEKRGGGAKNCKF